MNSITQPPTSNTTQPVAVPMLRVIIVTTTLIALSLVGLYFYWGRGPVIAALPLLVPLLQGAMGLAAFCVAFIAFCRFQVLRDPVSYWLGVAFTVFFTSIIFYILSWPGLLHNGQGIIAHLPGTSAWIMTIAQGLSGCLLLSAVLVRKPPKVLSSWNWLWAVAAWVAGSTVVYLYCVIFEARLPAMVTSTGAFNSLQAIIEVGLLVVFTIGAVLSIRRYRQTGDTLLAYIAVLQIVWTFAQLCVLIGGKRYDLWWYLDRLFITGGYLMLLFSMLSEYVRLYHSERDRSRALELSILDREQAENARMESEARMRATFEQGAVGLSIASLDGRFLHVNPACCAMLGYTESEFQARTFYDITYQDDLPANHIGTQRIVNGETTFFRMEKRYIHKDGHIVWVDMSSVAVCDAEGHACYYVTHIVDITERKQAEEALKESEAKYHNLFENMLEEVHFWKLVRDEDGRIQTWRLIDANPSTLQTWGKPLVEIQGKTTDEIFGPGATEHYLPVVNKVIREGKPYSYEDYFPPLNKYFRLTTVPFGEYFITTGADISERKRVEDELQSNLQRFYVVLSNMYAGVLLVTDENLVEFANQGFCTIYGLEDAPEELVGLSAHDIIEKVKNCYLNPDQAIARIREIIARGTPVHGEAIAMRNGRSCLRDYVPLSLPGKPNSRLWIHVDITEQKRAEETLYELTQRLTYHVDNSPLAVIEWGPDMRLTRWSGEAERIFGWKAEEVLGKQMDEFRWIYQEDQAQVDDVRHELQTGNNPHRFSANRNYRKDGSVVHCEWYNSSLVDASGQLRSILALVLDVTERKHTAEVLQASLREKDVLLKEIHHRVKNNMQIISSLVSLQADTLDNPALRGLFNDLRDQVRSMALVHEKLYQSESLARVDFAEYARSLLNYLWRAHGDVAENIRLTLDVQPTLLSVETAVPCGLILNELVTNTLKHAFPDHAGGEVKVLLHTDAEKHVSLCVSDNGVGMPAGLDWRQSTSLGLQLVQMLAGQLDGKVEMHSHGGTEFVLKFAQPKE